MKIIFKLISVEFLNLSRTKTNNLDLIYDQDYQGHTR